MKKNGGGCCGGKWSPSINKSLDLNALGCRLLFFCCISWVLLERWEYFWLLEKILGGQNKTEKPKDCETSGPLLGLQWILGVHGNISLLSWLYGLIVDSNVHSIYFNSRVSVDQALFDILPALFWVTGILAFVIKDLHFECISSGHERMPSLKYKYTTKIIKNKWT